MECATELVATGSTLAVPAPRDCSNSDKGRKGIITLLFHVTSGMIPPFGVTMCELSLSRLILKPLLTNTCVGNRLGAEGQCCADSINILTVGPSADPGTHGNVTRTWHEPRVSRVLPGVLSAVVSSIASSGLSFSIQYESRIITLVEHPESRIIPRHLCPLMMGLISTVSSAGNAESGSSPSVNMHTAGASGSLS